MSGKVFVSAQSLMSSGFSLTPRSRISGTRWWRFTLLPSPDGARDADLIEDYRGLFRARPGLSLAFAASFLSLA
jgi:hypothetical protein